MFSVGEHHNEHYLFIPSTKWLQPCVRGPTSLLCITCFFCKSVFSWPHADLSTVDVLILLVYVKQYQNTGGTR